MDLSLITEKLSHGFESTSQKLLFLVVVGGALLFVGYLLGDTLYHKLKWRRLNRKFKEASLAAEGRGAETGIADVRR